MKAAMIKPIHSEADYKEVVKRISALMDDPLKSEESGDELEVLAILAEEWENKTFKPVTITRTDMLNFLMDSKGCSASDLAKTVGTLGRVYQLINGTRKISDEMAVKLALYFGVTIETFDLPVSLLSLNSLKLAS